jgi:hypothetical protein
MCAGNRHSFFASEKYKVLLKVSNSIFITVEILAVIAVFFTQIMQNLNGIIIVVLSSLHICQMMAMIWFLSHISSQFLH